VAKFTSEERRIVDGIVASLSIERIPDIEIIEEIKRFTNKDKISRQSLYNIRQRIKKESAKWHSELRESRYEFIHEFKERINEIVDLQRRHYKIIEDNANNPSIQQTSLAELHKLNITLSNYFDVAPSIGNASISETPKGNQATTKWDNDNIIV
jgi:hypothetical protein